MFEHLTYEDDHYSWQGKVKSFPKMIWYNSYHHQELKKEIQKLAFDATIEASNLLFTLSGIASGIFRFPPDIQLPVDSMESAKKCEAYYCKELWDSTVFIAIDSIPATPEETKKLLKIIDFCAKKSFQPSISREDREIHKISRASGSMGTKSSLEEIEQKYMSKNLDGRRVPFGRNYAEWVQLISFKRPNDDLYEYGTNEESWDNLAGEKGVCLIRDGYVIGDIATCIN